MNYDMTGREVRRYERERRNRPSEPRMRDWAIPIIAACVLMTLVGLFLDPTSIFTVR